MNSAAPTRNTPAWFLAAQLALAAALLAYFHGPTAARFIAHTWNPRVFSDDEVMHLPPIMRYSDPDLFPGDYIMDYFHRAYLPPGYKAVYWAGAKLDLDPRLTSKLLTYALLLVFFGAITATAVRLGGVMAGWFALATALAAKPYIHQIAGGLPRSFAAPLAALAMLALARDRPWLMAITVVLAALFYPPLVVCLGLALALYLLVPQRESARTEAWGWGRRLTVVGAAAVVAFAVSLPTMLGGRQYGGAINDRDLKQMPEAAPGGRRRDAHTIPFYRYSVWDQTAGWLKAPLAGQGGPYVAKAAARLQRLRTPASDAILGLGLAGFLVLFVRDPSARRVAALPAASIAAFVLAAALSPAFNQPNRQLIGLGAFAAVMIPAGLSAWPLLAHRLRDRAWARPAFVIVLAGAFLLIAGRRGDERSAYTKVQKHDAVHAFLGGLPRNALIAGWPDDEGVIDHVPLLSQRSVLVNWEAHVVFHRGYVMELRRRTNALLEAYFATDLQPLRELRDRFGVTHLVVELAHYGPTPPTYFPPFDQTAAELHANALEAGPITMTLRGSAVYDDGERFVLDLSGL